MSICYEARLCFAFISQGRYFAEVIKQVFDLAKSRNVRLEPRLTLFGKDKKEWDMLANWVRTARVLLWVILVLYGSDTMYESVSRRCRAH